MYGKVFAQIYDGTLATVGPWQALVTFQQFIILANSAGEVDMTHEAIARRTTLPLEIIKIGVVALEQPDSGSRSPDLEGRRIVRLSDHRDWGWRVVNHAHYSKIKSEADRREYHREYYQKRKAASTQDSIDSTIVNTLNNRQHPQHDSIHVDVDVDVNVKDQKHSPPSALGFNQFWSAWPSNSRKGAKSKCLSVWLKNKYEGSAEAIVAHVEAMKQSDDWRKGYICAPLVYLNQAKWDGAETPKVERRLAI